MKNMKVKAKLIISFILVIVMAILVGTVGIVGMMQISNADQEMYDFNLLAIQYIGEIRTNYNIQRAEIRSMVIYDAGTKEYDTAVEQVATKHTEMLELIKKYRALITDDTDDEIFTKFENAYLNDFAVVKEEITAFAVVSDLDGATEVFKTKGTAAQSIIGAALTDCMEWNANAGKDAVEGNSNLFMMMTIIEVVVLALAVVVALILAFYISGLISKPTAFMKEVLSRIGNKGDLNFSDAEYKQAETYGSVKDEVGESVDMLLTMVRRLVKVGEALGTVSNGDLTAELALLSDVDTMGISLEKMVANLNSMFSEINQSTVQVSTGSKQIADGAQSLAQGSTEQASAVEQLSASISEIADKTQTNADMARKAAELSQTIKLNAETGSTQMDNMMQAVREINEACQSINKVIALIENIAFQTNILALNAAVEAARAGQHGKGFAVVAEEVRSLASKSADAAKNTSALIANSMEKAELGVRIASETASSLNEIVTGINESTGIINEIAHSSEEQAIGIKQINTGIDQVAQVVQQNSATAEESAAASEEMSGQSEMLSELIAQFKLKDGGDVYHRMPSAKPQRQLAMPPKPSTSSTSRPSTSGDFGKY